MLIVIETKERIDGTQFRIMNKGVSFPLSIKEETLRKYGCATLHCPEKPEVGEHQEVLDAGVEEIDGRWMVKWEVTNKSLPDILNNHPRIVEIKNRLDELDLKSIRPMRTIILRKGTNEDVNVLESIDKERDSLLNEMRVITEAAKMITNSK